jgi:hypothetical protein
MALEYSRGTWDNGGDSEGGVARIVPRKSGDVRGCRGSSEMVAG